MADVETLTLAYVASHPTTDSHVWEGHLDHALHGGAGPRESRSRGIRGRARQVLLEVFRREEREGRYILR